jgi:hypothetical protein
MPRTGETAFVGVNRFLGSYRLAKATKSFDCARVWPAREKKVFLLAPLRMTDF